jgi:methylenetetrahydrofolate dehydrogenase (NAD+)
MQIPVPIFMAGTNCNSNSCQVILAATIARGLLVEVSENLAKSKRLPLLVGFLANEDPAARKYAEWTDRTCREK